MYGLSQYLLVLCSKIDICKWVFLQNLDPKKASCCPRVNNKFVKRIYVGFYKGLNEIHILSYLCFEVLVDTGISNVISIACFIKEFVSFSFVSEDLVVFPAVFPVLAEKKINQM